MADPHCHPRHSQTQLSWPQQDSPADVKLRRDDTSPSPPGAQGVLLGTNPPVSPDEEHMPNQPSTWWDRRSVTGWTPLGLQGLRTLSQSRVSLCLHSRRRTKAAHSGLLSHPGNRSFAHWSPLTGRQSRSKDSGNYMEPQQGPSSCHPRH